MKIAAIQMISTPDLQANFAQATELLEQAAAQGAKMAALPEYFCLLGGKDRDKFGIREAFGDGGPIQTFLSSTAARLNMWIVGGTMPLDSGDDSHVLNSSLVFDDQGRFVTRYDKIHLFSFHRGQEAFDEAATIKPGHDVRVFDAPWGKTGMSVCYDLRFPEMYRSMGPVDLILVPSAFTYTTGQAHWELLLRTRAVENQCYVLAPAQGGVHPNGRHTWGDSMLIDPWGTIVARLPQGPGVVLGELDSARIAQVRESLPALRHRVI